jgi:23S rRNA (cytidine1920-2'-O)/16S rRNA (cytidine1409-2'-O)-methyltransferase
MGSRARLDTELVRRGLARSREQAAGLIADGRVLVAGQAAAKPATQVGRDAAIAVRDPAGEPDYASRGGRKLAGALAAFGGLPAWGEPATSNRSATRTSPIAPNTPIASGSSAAPETAATPALETSAGASTTPTPSAGPVPAASGEEAGGLGPAVTPAPAASGGASTSPGPSAAPVPAAPGDEAGRLGPAAGRTGGLVVTGRRCLDAGASTGGFTDVLLRAGAAHVVAVDVGYGQLAWPLRTDPRVTVLDRVNVRELTPEQVAPAPELVTADLSFISLTLVLPALVACAAPGADFVLLVKPQFEAGKGNVGAGGVVRDPAQRAAAVRSVAAAAAGLGLGTAGVTASPLPGPAGNVEYFLWLRAGAPPLEDEDLDRAIEDGPR